MAVEPILADTHALIWYFAGAGSLSARRVRSLDEAMRSGQLFGSVVSLFEIAGLIERRRLRSAIDIGTWMRDAEAAGLGILSLDVQATVEAARLPGAAPRDPFDRLLVGTARVHGLLLATRDGPILDYARQGYVRVLEV